MAKTAIHDERKKAGKPQIHSAVVKQVQQIEYGLDVLNQIALLRTTFEDGTSQDLPISRHQIPELATFLIETQQEFEAQDKAAKQ
jgi:hypothetical protein